MPLSDDANAPATSAHLDALPLFDSLPAETRRRLISAAAVRHFPAGATLFRAGDPATGLYVILEGRVRVLRARDGRQSVIHTEEAGGTLAEVPLFEGGVLPATAEAVTATHCLHIPGDALTTIMRTDPAVALLFLRRLSARVRTLVERLDRVSNQPVMARLAQFLLDRMSAHGADAFTLGMTQAQVAEELGTVREVIVRGLSQLRSEGIIDTIGRGHFAVLDLAALRRKAAS